MKKTRCGWAPSSDQLYTDYHDNEWGKPVFDDNILFEFMFLESCQAGLSWITILRKRENFRKAFDQFDYKKIAKYDDSKTEELVNNAGIIRHRGKIEAAINNAQKFIEIQDEFGSFSDYLWKYVNHTPIKNRFKSLSEIPAKPLYLTRLRKTSKKEASNSWALQRFMLICRQSVWSMTTLQIVLRMQIKNKPNL